MVGAKSSCACRRSYSFNMGVRRVRLLAEEVTVLTWGFRRVPVLAEEVTVLTWGCEEFVCLQKKSSVLKACTQ